MVNPPPVLSTVPVDTWVVADWDEFLTFADDPTLASGRFYYDHGCMRIEMAPLGSAHGQDNSIVSTVIVLYAAVNRIPVKELTNTSFRKATLREAQPDIAVYIGDGSQGLTFPPRNNAPINLNDLPPPALVVEIAATSLDDDRDRKQKLYQRLGVREYWVVDVLAGRVIAVTLSELGGQPIQTSQVLPGLDLAIVEEALRRSHSEDDGAITRWLLGLFSDGE